MAANHTRRGFTLIEVLVVVAIIIVLLGLLIGSLQQALFEAEMRQCAESLKAIGAGTATYAVNQQGFYPARETGVKGHAWRIDKLAEPDPAIDHRPLLESAIGLAVLQCPMNQTVDIGPRNDESEPASRVYASYNLWFGLRYFDPDTGVPLRGMMKMGDRFEWRGRSYNVLAGDKNNLIETVPSSVSSHPDRGGLLGNVAVQDEATPIPGEEQEEGQEEGQGVRYTYSQWQGEGLRGELDLNYVQEDGAVGRFGSVKAGDDDGRMAGVPMTTRDDSGPSFWTAFVPIR